MFHSKNGTKILTSYLRNKDFGTFLKFVECICAAHERPEGATKVELPIVSSIISVVEDFDHRQGSSYASQISEILHQYQKTAPSLQHPQQQQYKKEEEKEEDKEKEGATAVTGDTTTSPQLEQTVEGSDELIQPNCVCGFLHV